MPYIATRAEREKKKPYFISGNYYKDLFIICPCSHLPLNTSTQRVNGPLSNCIIEIWVRGIPKLYISIFKGSIILCRTSTTPRQKQSKSASDVAARYLISDVKNNESINVKFLEATLHSTENVAYCLWFTRTSTLCDTFLVVIQEELAVR